MNPQYAYIFLTKRPERVDFQTDDENVWMNIIMLLLNLSHTLSQLLDNDTEPLVMLCVQYKGETFTAEDATDGVILNDKRVCHKPVTCPLLCNLWHKSIDSQSISKRRS